MKQFFKSWKMTTESKKRLAQVLDVLDEFAAMEVKVTLTLRQLYYQLVTKNIIRNSQLEYRKLSALLSRARLAGLVDWDAIEDRARRPVIIDDWNNIRDLVESAIGWYRRPRWDDQPRYVELWSEKDAISSVISPITDRLHVTLMVNRGYSSQSAMKDSADRFKRRIADGKETILLYLGDFDPSGEDMVRDITDRFKMFEAAEVQIIKIGLTPEQVDQYNLPPNPAKTTDPRSRGFIDQHGGNSYEVDAIPPTELMKLVESSIKSFMDVPRFNQVLKLEKKERQELVEIVADNFPEDNE